MRRKIKMQWADRLWVERYNVEEMRRPYVKHGSVSGKTR